MNITSLLRKYVFVYLIVFLTAVVKMAQSVTSLCVGVGFVVVWATFALIVAYTGRQAKRWVKIVAPVMTVVTFPYLILWGLAYDWAGTMILVAWYGILLGIYMKMESMAFSQPADKVKRIFFMAIYIFFLGTALMGMFFGQNNVISKVQLLLQG